MVLLSQFPFSALTLLVGQQECNPSCENMEGFVFGGGGNLTVASYVFVFQLALHHCPPPSASLGTAARK